MTDPSSSQNVPDAELIRRWQVDRSQAAAERLYERYIEKLLARITANIASDLRGRVSAESVANSALGSLFHGFALGRFVLEDDEAVWKLLLTIALNKLYKRFRKKRPGTFTATGLDEEIAASDIEPTPDVVAIFRDDVERLMAALKGPIADYFSLRIQGYNQIEIAERMGVTDRQVRRYARALEIQVRSIFDLNKDEENEGGGDDKP